MKNLILSNSTKRKLEEKRLIFASSSGRCGTKFLAQAFQKTMGEDELSGHWETDPNFAWLVRPSRFKQGVAKKWWLKQKLPAILSHKQPVYIETSHYLTQGALGAALSLGIPFDLIVLSRPPRDTAVSFWRRHSIPLTKRDKLWPTDTGNFLPVRHDGWNDYQLVYWWLMEVRFRMWRYAQVNVQRGRLAVAVTLDEVVDWAGFKLLCERLTLPLPDHRRYPRRVVNPSDDEMYDMWPVGDLDAQEAEVWRCIHAHPRSRFTRPT